MRDGNSTTPLNCGYLPDNSTCVPYGCGSTRCGTFSTNPADTQLSQSTSNTNDSGVAEVTLKGTVLGVHTAEAILLNGNRDTKIVNIAPDASNAQVTLN